MDLYTTQNIDSLLVRYMGHVTYSNPWTHFTRTADEYILYVIQSGALYIKEGENFFTLKKGDTLLLDPHVEHTGFKASLCDYYFVHFRFPNLEKIENWNTQALSTTLKEIRQASRESSLYSFASYSQLEKSSIYFPKHYTPSDYGNLLSILEVANHTFYQKYENYRLIAILKLQELFISLSKDFTDQLLALERPTPTKSLNRALEIKDYLETHYSQKITSDFLSSHFDANYNYLNRLFTQLTGSTIINYLNEVRIQHAKALIASSSHLSFADIGYLVGIEDPYYFSKLFKKYAGITATAYAYSVAFKEYK